MNRIRIAAVLLIRLAISLTAIYILDTHYIYPSSALNYYYAILIGVGIILLDPRGTIITVHIKPIGPSGYNRMVGFMQKQESHSGRWKCLINPDGTGDCKTIAVGFCAETFSLFGRILAWTIYDTIPEPKNAVFSVSVENGRLGL